MTKTQDADLDGGPPTAASAAARPELDDGPAGLRRGSSRARPQDDADEDPDDEDGFDDGYDDEYEDDDFADAGRASSARDWAIVVGQLVLGALLGAVLWTVFAYLWRELQPVALVLALVVTVGLVFGVRAMRRSDDLKTTALAVGVGLVVTVSPAAFVLLNRG